MVNRVNFATLSELWQEYETQPRDLAFRATTVDEWKVWREQLSNKLVELLGGFPATRPALQPLLLDHYETPDYSVEKVAIHAFDATAIPCYVLTPREVAPPYRAVIALHGHGTGAAAHLLGIPRNEATRQEELAHIAVFNWSYAHQLAQRGFMVFVPEQRGFGERMEPHASMIFGGEMWQSSCRGFAFNAMLLGKTVLGLRVWDVMHTLDYIAGRAEVSTTGIGCVGLSGGGTTTLYAAALDPRITVAVVSGAFGTFRSSIMSTIHCECNYIPGILQVAEMADIASLIAPRPLLVESGTEDPIFPVEETELALQEVGRAYEVLGVPERLASDIFVGGHRFSGNLAFDWFDKWL